MPEKYVICPKCQTKVSVAYRGGRKPLNIGVKNVCDALWLHRNVLAADVIKGQRVTV